MNFHNTTLLEVTPSECFRLKFISIFLLFVFLIGVAFNSTLLWVFSEKKELRKPLDVLVIALTINNLFGCLIELPPLIISNFYCKYYTCLNKCRLKINFFRK